MYYSKTGTRVTPSAMPIAHPPAAPNPRSTTTLRLSETRKTHTAALPSPSHDRVVARARVVPHANNSIESASWQPAVLRAPTQLGHYPASPCPTFCCLRRPATLGWLMSPPREPL
jgi:hypothetical protein